MRDSKTLHFLKHFPAQYLLLFLFFVVFTFYVQTHDQFLQRLVDTILGAILGIVTGRWLPPNQSANTATGDVFITPKDGFQDLTESEINNALNNKEEN